MSSELFIPSEDRGIEQTVFFVKHLDVGVSDQIYDYLFLGVPSIRGIPLVQARGVFTFGEDFWQEFYSHLRELYPKDLDKMASEFAGKPIDLGILAGNNVITNVRNLVGETRYAETSPETIRRLWGHPDRRIWDNVAHSSDSPESVVRERELLRRYISE
jgi:nucleoside diphosphate kinase